ncbi:hypothetical protein AALB16_03710 [Lachnospiraceae bacterium 62-35]
MIALPVFIIPFAFVYCNGMLLFPGNPVGETMFAFVSAIIGVYAVAVGVAGFRGRRFARWEQAAYIAAGAVMVTPFVIPSAGAILIFFLLSIWERVSLKKLNN